MGVAETKIYPINTGWLEADLGTDIFGKGPAGKKIWNPVYCHYVDTGEHKILIDTGLNQEFYGGHPEALELRDGGASLEVIALE